MLLIYQPECISIQLSESGVKEKQNTAFHIAIIFDGKQTEDCIKNINKLHKMKTDDLCYLSLTQLKNSIIDCITMLKNHVCHCNLCKKKFKFNKIDKHLC